MQHLRTLMLLNTGRTAEPTQRIQIQIYVLPTIDCNCRTEQYSTEHHPTQIVPREKGKE